LISGAITQIVDRIIERSGDTESGQVGPSARTITFFW
jgi:hypothetical protein